MGRTQEHVGVWMCWVRVRRVVRRVWVEHGRRNAVVRARDSMTATREFNNRRGRPKRVCDGGGCAFWRGYDTSGALMVSPRKMYAKALAHWSISRLHNAYLYNITILHSCCQHLHVLRIATTCHHEYFASPNPIAVFGWPATYQNPRPN